MRPVVCVFSRLPSLGHGKTRLASDLGAPATHELAQLLLKCTLRNAMKSGVPVVLCYSGDAEARLPEYAQLATPHRLHRLPASNRTLSDLVSEQVDLLLAREFSSVIVVPSDAPTVTGAMLAEAARSLDHETDVYVIPSDDGGFAALGVRRSISDWFSTLDLAAVDLVDRIAEAASFRDLAVRIGEGRSDIDTFAALQRALAAGHLRECPEVEAFVRARALETGGMG